MADTPQQQKRTPELPPELEKLIHLINGLPKDACDTGTIEREIQLSNPELGVFDVMKQIANRFEADLEPMPTYLREHIGPARDQQGLVTDIYSQARYNELVITRAVLDYVAVINTSGIELARLMAQANEEESQRRDVRVVTRDNLLRAWERLPMSEVLTMISPSSRLPLSELRDFKFSIGLGWNIKKTRRGRELKVRSFPKVEVIEQIDCLRIRRCPRCDKFFFARRMHQSACPEPCAHILRTLQWRENYQEKYKQQRIKKADARDAQTKRKRG